MKTWKHGLLMGAMTMAVTANAQSTTSPAAPSTAAKPPGTTMRSDIPKECVNLTGTAMSDCVRDHNPSSMRSKSGTNGSTTNSMRNDKSGGGTTGGGNAGNSGTSGSAGASGSGTGGAASGGTGGDNGNGSGGGNGK